MAKVAGLALRLLEADAEICRRATAAQAKPAGRVFFRAVSWLGDGPFWFALALGLPLALGGEVLPLVAQLAVVGVLATVTAKLLKIWTKRVRPYIAHPGIAAGARALDAGSFPSGHTLHAAAFTMVTLATLPALAPLLLPFALAIAASRIVLGLHYPSDVAAGALVGALLGAAVLWLS